MSPLATAAMQVIRTAPAEDPADTDTIIVALGGNSFRTLITLSRLQLSGQVTSERIGRDRVYRPR